MFTGEGLRIWSNLQTILNLVTSVEVHIFGVSGYAILKLFIKEEEYKGNLGIIIILSSPSLSPSMKCWNLAYNAQGSRAIIVVVQVGAVKLYVTALERKMERQEEIQYTAKIGVKQKFGSLVL
jgi:hypothetical protein